MSKRRKRPEQVTSAESVRLICLAVLAALFVATPLILSESAADQGSGLVLVVLHLVLASVWLAAKLLLGQHKFKIDLISIAVVGLAVWHGISALVMAPHGAPRPAMNMFWQWTAYATAFLLARDLVRSKRECRALCAVMIGLAVCLSTHAYYQFAVELPATRRAYQANPESYLKEQGLYFPPGSVAREMLEQRLLSTEPTATFALTNSLAGFLAPWFVLTIAAAAMAHRRRVGTARFYVGVLVVAMLLGGCLLLTKSRTAVLAVALGILLVGASRVAGNWRLGWKIPLAVCAVIVLLGAATVAVGVLDVEVVSEAPKSLLYRFQYWHSTACMIADYPVFGCGPGNFQSYYTAYMLPQASEQVADPHNFLFEVWATAGTPALLLLAVTLGMFGWGTWRDDGSPDAVGQQPFDGADVAPTERAVDGAHRRVYIGALCGVVLAYPIGLIAGVVPAIAVLWLGLPVAAVTIWLLHDWVVGGVLSARCVAIATAVLLVNLLAAGGINLPGVAGSLWLLMALGLNLAEPADFQISASRWATVGRLVTVLVLLAACYHTAYRPVLKSQAWIERGEDRVFAACGPNASGAADRDMSEALACFTAASRTDKYAPQAWLNRARMYHELLLRAADRETQAAARREFERAADAAMKVDRRSHALAAELGYLEFEAYAAIRGRRHLTRARQRMERGVNLFPSNAYAHARLAWMYHLAGNTAAAADSAAEALRLDALMPHQERKLHQRGLFDDLAAPAQLARLRGFPADKTAEQLMHALRSETEKAEP